MLSPDLQFVLALQHVPNLGDATAKKLIHHVGSAEAVFKEKKSALLKIDGIGNHKISGLYDSIHFSAAEEELKFIEQHKIDCFYFEEKDYPEKLKHCLDGPILLFRRGNVNLENRRNWKQQNKRIVRSCSFCGGRKRAEIYRGEQH